MRGQCPTGLRLRTAFGVLKNGAFNGTPQGRFSLLEGVMTLRAVLKEDWDQPSDNRGGSVDLVRGSHAYQFRDEANTSDTQRCHLFNSW